MHFIKSLTNPPFLSCLKFFYYFFYSKKVNLLQFIAVDVSAISSMKSAAKSDIYCELQNYANHQNLERNLHLEVTLLGILVWVSNINSSSFLFRKERLDSECFNYILCLKTCCKSDLLKSFVHSEMEPPFWGKNHSDKRNESLGRFLFLQKWSKKLPKCSWWSCTFFKNTKNSPFFFTSTSNQVWLRAEFKHINKRRKRN